MSLDTRCCGRCLNNATIAFNAVLTTPSGSPIFLGSGTTGLSSTVLSPTAASKTVIVFSDGVNWTVGQLN